MLLNIEKSGEQDKEHSYEWLVNNNPFVTDIVYYFEIVPGERNKKKKTLKSQW